MALPGVRFYLILLNYRLEWELIVINKVIIKSQTGIYLSLALPVVNFYLKGPIKFQLE